MTRSRLTWLTAATGFLALLVYVTVVSRPAPPPSGLAHDARGAEQACASAVSDSVAGARFPFGANVAYQGDARYRLSGTVEASLSGGQMRRSNYECVIQYEDSGAYRARSVRVWQSH